MKAPEKLYLSKNIYSTFVYQTPDPDDETQVEYSNTDTFIEKACDVYCKVCEHYAEIPTHICRQDCRYFDDFKKYMKGE